MSETCLTIRGIDPLLFRDGRPFSTEIGSLSAQTLPLPLPGTLAGALRTRLGDVSGWNWKERDDGPTKALSVSVRGPILLYNDSPVLPAPADALVCKDEHNVEMIMALRPDHSLPESAGCDLPAPAYLKPLKVTGEHKPVSDYPYWTWDDMRTWLLDATGVHCKIPTKIGRPETDDRVHVGIDAGTQTSKEGMLFSTRSLSFEKYPRWNDPCAEARWSLLARVASDHPDLIGSMPFGGERRMAIVEKDGDALWPLPDDVSRQIPGDSSTIRLRLVLATPAIFQHGWRPGWLNAAMKARLDGVELALIGAAVKRREPVSGWDYRDKKPKPVRWMVPAGSVYFFEATGDVAALVKNTWLNSVCDNDQDRKDGYGLALWGIWNS